VAVASYFWNNQKAFSIKKLEFSKSFVIWDNDSDAIQHVTFYIAKTDRQKYTTTDTITKGMYETRSQIYTLISRVWSIRNDIYKHVSTVVISDPIGFGHLEILE
jgi:hypothetical protein